VAAVVNDSGTLIHECNWCGEKFLADTDIMCPQCGGDDVAFVGRLPTVDEMYGSDPNFTGGLDSTAYLRSLRPS
jgi:hypothetical protein